MSFYGNVLYELTNAFSKIIIKNYNSTNSTILEGFGLNNTFELNSGNKWITLNGNTKNLSCSIAHAARDQNDRSNSALGLSQIQASQDAIQLLPGDYLESSQFFYDDAGHISFTTPVKFRLPISETEEDLKDIQNQLESLEKSNENVEKVLTDHNQKINAVTTTADNAADSVNKLDKRVGSQTLMTLSNNMTITGAIGNFDNMSKVTNYTSICGGIESLRGSLDGQNVVISNNALAVRTAVKNLCDELALQGINIDYDSLWKE